MVPSLQAVVSDDVRVIICLAFDDDAPPLEIARLKSCLLECEHVLHAVEIVGAFDLMVDASFASLLEYNERMGVAKAAAAQLIARYEANFICRRFVRHADKDHAIWVRCEHGKVRIDYKLIDKIVAEGDYMRLHCGAASYLVHMTMHAMCESLGGDFVLVHRSLLVHRDFIDQLIHRDSKWIARLKDGEHVIIAKAHVADVMASLHVAPAKIHSSSSKDEELVEQSPLVPSKRPGDDRKRQVAKLLPST